ncbi:MAG: kynureninase, partial [Bdellovibrionota bacterium]
MMRDRFHIPRDPTTGLEKAYFSGNSLGLQPKAVRARVEEVLEAWARLGVDGHLEALHPWFSYHENLTQPMARIVGALPAETVVMNTLTVNLHLCLVSFYRPTRERFKILVEKGAFPSDQYAVASQAEFHGFAPERAIVEIEPRTGEDCLRTEDILAAIARHGGELSLVLLGNVNYRTGQAFSMREITAAAHAQGARVGWDLAHGAGNLPLALNDSGADFAVWCSYKYLNGGPGALGGCFIHERHHGGGTEKLPRFAGWWGHEKAVRFKMGSHFQPIPGAEGWQLSNPPILSMAALAASLT